MAPEHEIGIEVVPPPHGSRQLLIAAWLIVMTVALAVRLPGLTAAWPYMSYIDEGHLLHWVVDMLHNNTWLPTVSHYPPPMMVLMGLACRVYAPFYALQCGHSLVDDLSAAPPVYYDLVSPPEILLCGRITTLLVSLCLVVLVGLYASRLWGRGAGLLAAWWAALMPPFVYHSNIAVQDPLIALFAVAAFWAMEPRLGRAASVRDAVFAGVLAGCSAGTKYTTGLIVLAILVRVICMEESWRRRLVLMVGAAGGFAAGFLVCVAPLLRDIRAWVDGLRYQSLAYEVLPPVSTSFQAFVRSSFSENYADMGYPLAGLLAVSTVVALVIRRSRPAVMAMLVFFALTELLLVRYPYRPFRNQLPFLALGCVLLGGGGPLGAWIRQRWVWWIAAVLPVALFLPPLVERLQAECSRTDSRIEVVDYLAARVQPNDEVWVDQRLVILPSELVRIPGRTVVTPADRLSGISESRRSTWLVCPTLPESSARLVMAAGMSRQFSFGSAPLPAEAFQWRGNSLRIDIYR